MKKYYLPILFVAACSLFSSCSKNDISEEKGSGTTTFNLNSSSSSLSKALNSITNEDSLGDSNPFAIVISIVDSEGTSVVNTEQIPLYNMNGRFISKPISLKPGSYKLTDFLVIDSKGNVIYLTPKEGSPKAYLVKDPLPVDFSVTKDQVKNVTVEVLKNLGEDPKEFGYSTFSFNVVDVFNFYVSALVYSDSTQNFILTNANITINRNGNSIYNNVLLPKTNVITLRKDYGIYSITIKKDGYEDYNTELTLANLQEYSTKPLIIVLNKTSFNFFDGLVAYYPFNGNANDESGNNHNATVYGASLATDRFNKPNSAYEFDGYDDYINTFSTFDFNYRTISFWANAYEIDGTGYGKGIPLVQDSEENTYGIVVAVFGEGALYLNAGGANAYDLCIKNNVSKNTWYHIVLVRNNTQLLYYVNGELIYTGPSSSLSSSANPYKYLLFGSGRTRTIQFFNGKVDDVAVYNRALSASEINLLYIAK